ARLEALTSTRLATASEPSHLGEAMNAEVEALLAQPLSAESAAKLALLGNRELRATLRSLGVARGNLVQAGLLPNPVFEFDIRRSQGRPSDPLQGDVYLEYDIKHALLTGARGDVARAELEAARYDAA